MCFSETYSVLYIKIFQCKDDFLHISIQLLDNRKILSLIYAILRHLLYVI